MVMTIVMIVFLQVIDWKLLPTNVMVVIAVFIQVLVVATVFFTVFSMIDYVIKNKQVLKN